MRHYTHLSLSDRRRLYVLKEMGISIAEIARRLNKHRSTIYRELSRNGEEIGYYPKQAQKKSQTRRQRPYTKKLIRDGHLRDYVERALKKGWSPEQISGRMKYKRLSYYVCAETIYQYVYHQDEKKLYLYLPHSRTKRRSRRYKRSKGCRYGAIKLIS